MICVPVKLGNVKAHGLLKDIIFSALDWQNLTIISLTIFQCMSLSLTELHASCVLQWQDSKAVFGYQFIH